MRSGIGKTAPLAKPLDSLPQMLPLSSTIRYPILQKQLSRTEEAPFGAGQSFLHLCDGPTGDEPAVVRELGCAGGV